MPRGSFIARIIKDTKADKHAKMVVFHDGAEVPFYVHQHSRAAASKKHIYIGNNQCKIKINEQCSACDEGTEAQAVSPTY